jgi:hypothetical protein
MHLYLPSLTYIARTVFLHSLHHFLLISPMRGPGGPCGGPVTMRTTPQAGATDSVGSSGRVCAASRSDTSCLQERGYAVATRWSRCVGTPSGLRCGSMPAWADGRKRALSGRCERSSSGQHREFSEQSPRESTSRRATLGVACHRDRPRGDRWSSRRSHRRPPPCRHGSGYLCACWQ